MIDKTLFSSGDVVAVALSGGKDSVCLLHLLLSLREELNITVKAVHIDHSIRGKDSENDANFVKNYCEKLGVLVKVFKVDAPLYSKQNNLSLEQGARALRYGVFKSVLDSGFANLVATAHHKNDNFESLLFNIFRGTGLKGAGGIPSKNGEIVRPLLSVTREEIDRYVQENNLPFTQDLTNFSSEFSRNYIRNEIVPKIVERFPNAVNAGAKFSAICKEEDEFLQKLSSDIITQKDGKVYIPLSSDGVLVKRAIILALSRLGLEKDYEYVHVLDVFNLKDLQSGAKITLPKSIVAQKEYDYAVLYIDNEQKNQNLYPFGVGAFDFDGDIFEISSIGGSLKFDGDKIPNGAVIRTRRDGDVFKKFGGGTKKLKEFLIDKKIPLSKRDKLPLIAKDNTVYLIFGVEISDDIKITSKTTNVLYAK
jgi:tRNA(Ile)-lysidine synthase